MKFIALLSALVPALVGAVSTPTSTFGARNGPLFNPDVETYPIRRSDAAAPVPAASFSNAERLARGLPLNKPRHLSRKSNEAKRSTPSGTPSKSNTGTIQVFANGGGSLGYVRSTLNSFGEYGLTTDHDAAQTFSFTADGSGPFDITAVGGVLPFFGGMTGFSSSSYNLGPGSASYAYLGDTAHTEPDAIPAVGDNTFTRATKLDEGIESAIWSYDPSSATLTPQWINLDGSKPATYLGVTQDVLVLTGDETSFRNAFGPTTYVHLVFVAL